MSDTQKKLTRIGVFYDGNYFLHVSNYYAYHHERRGRLSIAGLHEFIRHKIADEEQKDMHLCQIVDAHYFRGRLSAQEASTEGNRLFYDRLFDDILMMEGVTTHYLPVRTTFYGQRQERGIDVWMALEAYELALHKQFESSVGVVGRIDRRCIRRRWRGVAYLTGATTTAAIAKQAADVDSEHLRHQRHDDGHGYATTAELEGTTTATRTAARRACAA